VASVEGDTARPAEKQACGVHFVPGRKSTLVAEALLAHVLQRGVQALVILVT
jgi:hypothetical protein